MTSKGSNSPRPTRKSTLLLSTWTRKGGSKKLQVSLCYILHLASYLFSWFVVWVSWKFTILETVFEVVNQENDKLDQKRKSKLANINGHGKSGKMSKHWGPHVVTNIAKGVYWAIRALQRFSLALRVSPLCNINTNLNNHKHNRQNISTFLLDYSHTWLCFLFFRKCGR